jgi:hypothetical protein
MRYQEIKYAHIIFPFGIPNMSKYSLSRGNMPKYSLSNYMNIGIILQDFQSFFSLWRDLFCKHHCTSRILQCKLYEIGHFTGFIFRKIIIDSNRYRQSQCYNVIGPIGTFFCSSAFHTGRKRAKWENLTKMMKYSLWMANIRKYSLKMGQICVLCSIKQNMSKYALSNRAHFTQNFMNRKDVFDIPL